MLTDGSLFKTNTFVSARYFDVGSEQSHVRPDPLRDCASLQLTPEIATQRHERIASNVSSFPKIRVRIPPGV